MKKKRKSKINQKNQVKITNLAQRDLRSPPIKMSFVNLLEKIEFDLNDRIQIKL
jgi:hypothetical protein